MFARRVDPAEKKKKRNKGARVRRINGELVATKGDDYYDSDEDIAARRKLRAKNGDGSFTGAPGPRVGGVAVKKSDGPVQGGTKKQIRKSARRVKKNAASPQAKRSAIRLYRG